MGSELAHLQRTEFGAISVCQKLERVQALFLPALFEKQILQKQT